MTAMVFITINRNSQIMMWLDEPHRIDKLGKWIGNYCYVNSKALSKAQSFAKSANMTWESDPVPIQI